MAVTPRDIHDAAAAIKSRVVKTLCAPSSTLTQITGADLESIVVPVSGGGFIAGCAVAAKSVNPKIALYGVETKRQPSMFCALKETPSERGTCTIAEGIAIKEPKGIPLKIVRDRVDDILLVDEGDIEKAVLLLLEVEKTVVEGAGAVG